MQIEKRNDMANLVDKLRDFVTEHCEINQRHHVGSADLRGRFEKHSGQQVPHLKQLMLELGYKWGDKKVMGKAVKSFFGLSLQNCD